MPYKPNGVVSVLYAERHGLEPAITFAQMLHHHSIPPFLLGWADRPTGGSERQTIHATTYATNIVNKIRKSLSGNHGENRVETH